MIHFSDAYGVAQPISKLKKILSSLGPKGSFTWTIPGKKDAVIEVSDSASVKITFPLKIDYEITAEKLILNFSQPYPIGSALIFNKFVQSATVHGTSRIEFELLRSPNGYVNIKS